MEPTREEWYQQRIAELERVVAALTEENYRLRDQVAKLSKNSSNSSKPPSSDIVKPPKPPSGKPSNGKAGGQPGHAKYERTPFPPEQIDQTRKYELSKRDAAGLKPLNDWHVVQQIELKERPFWIVEYRARKYLDPVTGRIVIAPLPPEVVRGGLVGWRLSALIAYQKSGGHMSYTTIQTFLKDVFGVSLSTGQLAKVVQKASVPARRDWPGRMTNFGSLWRPRRAWASTRRATRRTGTTCGPGAFGPTTSRCFISIPRGDRRS